MVHCGHQLRRLCSALAAIVVGGGHPIIDRPLQFVIMANIFAVFSIFSVLVRPTVAGVIVIRFVIIVGVDQLMRRYWLLA